MRQAEGTSGQRDGEAQRPDKSRSGGPLEDTVTVHDAGAAKQCEERFD